ncbi:25354_t:CDS:1, partial [Gigaspora margarita]
LALLNGFHHVSGVLKTAGPPIKHVGIIVMEMVFVEQLALVNEMGVF